MLGEHLVDYSLTGRIAGPMGNRHAQRVPQGVYACQGQDRWLALSVGSDDEWQRLCQAIGQPQLAQDLRFATVLARRQHHTELDQILSRWTQQHESYQAMHILQTHGVPAGAVLTGGETLADPHLQARDFWEVVDHPEAGTYQQFTPPWRLSRNPRRTTLPAPGLGDHNRYVLGELLSLTEPEIVALEAEGIIGTRPFGAEEG
jgi:crotonobetainyl-CoA:carnitine CoA-transferase CaiB-like acyl-CoA transferase